MDKLSLVSWTNLFYLPFFSLAHRSLWYFSTKLYGQKMERMKSFSFQRRMKGLGKYKLLFLKVHLIISLHILVECLIFVEAKMLSNWINPQNYFFLLRSWLVIIKTSLSPCLSVVYLAWRRVFLLLEVVLSLIPWYTKFVFFNIF